MTETINPHPDDKPFVVTRVFDAPRELVFKAFTETERLAKWWGPAGFKMVKCQNDARPGGTFHYGMTAPGGPEMWGKWVFREVEAPGRLVFVSSMSDAIGSVTRHPWAPQWPLETLSTITLTETDDGKTLVRLEGIPISATEAERKIFAAGHESMQKGFAGTLDQLEAHLAEAPRRELVLERVLDAPRDLVFRAWTDPKHLARWWGPGEFTNPVCEFEARVGGAIHIVMRAPWGAEYPMTGIVREIVEPERLVFTNCAVDTDGNHLLEGRTVVTFAEQEGKTRLRVQTEAVGLVDAAVAMLQGMEAGWTQSIDRLEGHVTEPS